MKNPFMFVMTVGRHRTRYVNVATGAVTVVPRTAGETPAAAPPSRQLAPSQRRRQRRIDPEAEALRIERGQR
jgi:hypothetical protein